MKLLRRYHEKIIAVVLGAAFVFFAGCAADLDEKNGSAHGFGAVTVSASGSRQLDIPQITNAVVQVSGYKMETKSAESAVSGGKGSVTVEQIPAGKKRIVTVQAFGGETKLDGVTIRATADITAGANTSVSVDWESSKKGAVYNALLESGVDIGNLTDEQAARIEAAIPDIHASLINAAAIAADFDGGNGTLKGKDEYKLSAGTVNVTANGCAGCTVQITDPTSAVSKALSSDSGTVSISIVAPGTWRIYVLDGTAKKYTQNITIAGGEEKDVVIGKIQITDKILVHVPRELNYTHCYAWGGADTSASKWPGKEMQLSGNYYNYTLNCTSTKIIFNNGSGGTAGNGQTADLYIPSAGEYWYIGGTSGTRDTDGTKVSSNFTTENPAEPLPPTIIISPAGGKIALNKNISVSLTDGTGTITTASVTAGSVSKSYSDFTDNTLIVPISDITTAEGTEITITVSATNSIGTKTASASFTTIAPVSVEMPSEWNELRIYQVMVSSFQDGDPTIGFTTAYGPSGALTGGDLQGVINALDYIKSLGMNAVWMTPIFQSAGSGQLDSTGYFCSDYFHVDNRFGTNEKLAELIEKAHDKGIAIILDGVFGHHGGSVASSPSGKTVSGKNPVNYPASLEFYEEVASYWIKNYKIDGWRFDQCYQVGLGDKGKNCSTGGHNYWYEIRNVIKDAAASNGSFGTEWGTLGYTVGEHWDGDAANIQAGSVAPGSAAGYGLQSCFDFPARYNLINAFAKAESDAGGNSLGSAVSYTYKTYSQKGYTHTEGYYPNVFITNHDLVRFGNLINWKYGDSNSTERYWGLHKAAVATLAAYSGPITIYYGDEWGAYVNGYTGPGALGAYNDNASRSTGKISGFTSSEQSVVDFTSKVMALRAEYPALWKGTATDIKTEVDYYVGKKTLNGEKSIGVIINKGSSSVSNTGLNGVDLIDGGTFNGFCPAYSAKFILLD